MTDFAPPDPLPGLAPPAPESRPSELELAARRTLAALDALDLLTERHAVHAQLLLDLARGYSRSVEASGGKVTVAASAVAAQIQNLLDSLPTPDTEADDDAWTKLVEAFRHAGGRSASGHPAEPGPAD